jgi:hypothetical protein
VYFALSVFGSKNSRTAIGATQYSLRKTTSPPPAVVAPTASL